MQVAQEYQCYISPYYIDSPQATAWAVSDRVYHPLKYFNQTDGIEETLCVDLYETIDNSTCNHATVVPTQAYIDSLTSDTELI